MSPLVIALIVLIVLAIAAIVLVLTWAAANISQDLRLLVEHPPFIRKE